MPIRKSSRRDITNTFNITGRERLFLDVTLPSGQAVQIGIELGTVGVDGREYFVIDSMFDKKADVEYHHDIPQQLKVIVRMPKPASDEDKKQLTVDQVQTLKCAEMGCDIYYGYHAKGCGVKE